ncbi:MAG: hypothetical protein AAGC44_05215 [Planctomycetota bacterium]
MRIKLTAPALIGTHSFVAGDVVELDDDHARNIIAKKHAAKVHDKTPLTEIPEPVHKRLSQEIDSEAEAQAEREAAEAEAKKKAEEEAAAAEAKKKAEQEAAEAEAKPKPKPTPAKKTKTTKTTKAKAAK